MTRTGGQGTVRTGHQAQWPKTAAPVYWPGNGICQDCPFPTCLGSTVPAISKSSRAKHGTHQNNPANLHPCHLAALPEIHLMLAVWPHGRKAAHAINA